MQEKNGYSCLDMLGEETRNIQLRVEKMRVEGNKEEGDLKNWKNVFIPCWCWGHKVSPSCSKLAFTTDRSWVFRPRASGVFLYPPDTHCMWHIDLWVILSHFNLMRAELIQLYLIVCNETWIKKNPIDRQIVLLYPGFTVVGFEVETIGNIYSWLLSFHVWMLMR